MARSALLAGLAALAAAQIEPTAPGFTFTGCVEADPALFPVSIAFFARFTSVQCQQAAGSRGGSWAALGPGGCRSDDPLSGVNVTYTVVDGGRCSVLCIPGREGAGHCGGPTQDGARQVYDLFENQGTACGVGEQ